MSETPIKDVRSRSSAADYPNNTSLRVNTRESRSRSSSSINLARKSTLGESDYVARLRRHAGRTEYQSLYSARNFEKLVDFLEATPYQPVGTPPGSQPADDTPLFATLYLLQSHESTSKDFPSRDVLNTSDLRTRDEELRGLASPRGNGNQLLFLRGFPTSAWLRTIGSYYTVDPEFFRRHLDLSLFANQYWFSNPSLPSTSRDFIRLRVTSLFRRKHECDNIEVARYHARETMQSYIEDVSGRNLTGELGESLVRRFSVLDRAYCSLEQDISLCCCRSDHGWTVIAWLDSGKDLERSYRKCNSPWKSRSALDTSSEEELSDFFPLYPIPVIRNEPRTTIHTSDPSDRSDSLKARAEKFHKSRALLSLDYGRQFDTLDVHDDALFAALPIFKFKEAAESQFLNLVNATLHNRLDETQVSNHTSQETYLLDLSASHNDFAYHKELLEHHVEELAENLRAIRAHGKTRWPCNKVPEVVSALEVLEENFVWLETRAQNLSALCDRAMKEIHNKSVLAESQGANRQSDEINKLNKVATFLSVFYIPLSFVSGFFGMNFTNFGQGSLPIWVYFVTAAPVLACSILFMFWREMTWRQKKADRDSGRDAASRKMRGKDYKDRDKSGAMEA